FSFVWAWFEEAGGYRFLLVVLKIVSFSADFRHFFIGVGYLYWKGNASSLRHRHYAMYLTIGILLRCLCIIKQDWYQVCVLR
ncbi:hypothetical protein M5Z47_08670, partial [Neisseria meningitidis]|nr:hypothetical protein [Neisseria meningitidis]